MNRLLSAAGLCLILLALPVHAQDSPLTVAKIMQDPATWVGDWPSQPFWSEDGQTLYFNWNPQGQFPSDSLFKVPKSGGDPMQVSPDERRGLRTFFRGWARDGSYDADFNRKVFTDDGDLFLHDRAAGTTTRLTQTRAFESSPRFTPDGTAIVYAQDNNLYRHTLTTGQVVQLTDLRQGSGARPDRKPDERDAWLEEQQEDLFEIIRQRKAQREARNEARTRDADATAVGPTPYYYGRQFVQRLQIDPAERFVTFYLGERRERKTTIVQDYVTESGYAEDLNARVKVGEPGVPSKLTVQDLERDTTYQVDLTQIEGAYDVPAYLAEQGVEVDSSKARVLNAFGPYWSPDGRYAVLDVNSYDNKDRWLVRLDPETGDLTTLDRQHDEAWIAGPGISWWSGSSGWMPDGRRFYFQSERTGYSHLYTVDVETGNVEALTSGDFEVFSPTLSRDGRHWMFTSSEVSPHVRHFYRMPADGGRRTQLTTMTGNNSITLHPDGETMANLYSFSNRPPEVYLHTPGDEPEQITTSPTDDWLAYDWRAPEIIRFTASDGVEVPARIYEPEDPNGAAVLFVHGAGYLQNVHQWWSTYFREYMFHNMLADMGYVVLDVDYRASAGYGRDWRTAIYRHMGGRDLQDYVDASQYAQETYDIDAERVFIYGGSYGGFITLMALFNEAEHFGGGAALRSVTDWAHYNHGYTSNILNTPATDSLSFALSSPINFAEGLEDPLVILHGMIDTNVQFQDVVRLAQRLIELGKEDWEMAVYPIEGHGFTEPASWTDEYRRILKLIEETVGPEGSKAR
ncbi:MAG: prolyl oligopeptidase family serine peptidase [Bacteroidota bacterium]